MVEIVENATDAPAVHVWLANGETTSGLGQMTKQYLEQTFADDPEKRLQVAKLRGTVALEATDSATAVTLDFQGDEIWVKDGVAESVDAYVGAPFPVLLDLLGGRANPLGAAVRRRVRARVSPRRPLFGLQVLRVLKAPPAVEERPGALRALAERDWVRGALLGVVVGFAVTFGVRALRRREMPHG